MAVAPRAKLAALSFTYAWVVLGILFVMQMLNQGDRAFFGNFFKPLQEQFGTNRATLSLAVSVNTVVAGAVLPIWGRIFDRYGPRAVILPASLFLAIGFALLPTASALWQLYAYFGVLIGIGLAGTNASITFAIGARWFQHRRSFAFGVLAAGGMAGSFVMVPGTMFLLLNIGWQTTFVLVAALSLLVGAPYIFRLVPATPEARAAARAAPTDPPAPAPVVDRRVGIGRAVRTGAFWLLAIPSWVSGFTGTLVQVHVIPMLTDRGFDPQESANAVGMISGVGLLAVLIGGLLAAKWGERPVLALIYLLRALGIVILAFAHNLPVLYLSVLLIGLSWGGVQPMVGGITGDVFGRGSLAGLLGWIFMTQSVLGAGAAILGGAVYDLTGDYTILILITGASLLIGVPMSLAIARSPIAEARPGRRAGPSGLNTRSSPSA